uniref:Integrase catalytic domain-containing protein n=1 Tax=Nicotiana tabacum TaxID=4097 RepID=A0A1S4B0X2_TOBAC|nr:PREDICTED: uncharacterized protein LOC107803396 [Nicotiana tabacum]
MEVKPCLRKVLRLFVSHQGIEVNPDQIKSIEGIPELLTTKKQVQRLTGRIATLSRFILRSSDRCHKFFGILKNDNSLEWTPECAQALRELKEYLSSPPMLSKPEHGKQLLVYLAVFEEALDQILRIQNVEADGLAKLAASTKSTTTGVKSVVYLLNSSLDQIEDGTLPGDKKEAKKLRMQAARYSLLHNDLYKRTYGGPLTKSLGPNQTQRVLEEVNEGHCGAHFDNQALVEAGAFTQIREQEVITFIWRNIICRFGLPKEISCDNGPQFTGKKIAKFFEKWHIKRILSTPYHPMGNGQAESSKKSILNIIKKKFEDTNGLWQKYYQKYYGPTEQLQRRV